VSLRVSFYDDLKNGRIRPISIRQLRLYKHLAVKQAVKRTKSIDALGVNAHGINALGIYALGIYALGVYALGLNALGINALGVYALDVYALGIYALGINALGGYVLSVKADRVFLTPIVGQIY